MSKRRAFTLIELLTVMAITSILLTIITIPVVQSFNLTRATQGFADAQDKARQVIDQVTREISNASAVRDNSGDRGAVDVVVPMQASGAFATVRLPYAKLDIIMPGAGYPEFGPSGALRNPNQLIDPNGDPNDPNNWKEDPTLRTPTGQVNLPTSGGFRMVRYFVGLKLPFQGNTNNPARYNNPYSTVLTQNGGPENLYVLYRAEVETRKWNAATQQWVFNNDVFTDTNNDGIADDVDDPAFFLADGTAAKASRIRNWLRRSRIITDLSRYDMIQPELDKGTFRAIYDATGMPRVTPLIQFRPSRVVSEPVEAQMAVQTGQEFNNAQKMGSETLRTKFGGWTDAFVRFWPSVPNPQEPHLVNGTWQAGTPHTVGRAWRDLNGNRLFSVFDVLSTEDEQSQGVEMFDVTAYQFARGFPAGSTSPIAGDVSANFFPYPFTYALAKANERSNWLTAGRAGMVDRFSPFSVDQRSGKVVGSFGIEEVGGVGTGPRPDFASGEDNRPRANTGLAVRPTNSGFGAINGWQNATIAPSSPTSGINERFNWLFDNITRVNAALAPVQARRFLDLRLVPNLDGSPSPLHPTLGFPRARIVPGSEVVIGPDQLGTGRMVRYTRVNADGGTTTVGPNQYRINYVDQPDLTDAAYQELGFTGRPNPTTYDPNNFAQVFIQSRYRAGYIEFNSDPQRPLPDITFGTTAGVGNISIAYRFQFIESTDVFAVDYDTRQVIDINLTIRNYPQTTLPTSQTVTLKGAATVRNFIR